MLSSINRTSNQGGVPSTQRGLRHKRELPIVFAPGTPVRVTAEAKAFACSRNQGGVRKIFTGVVPRKLTTHNIWTGQIPVRLTGSAHVRLMPAHHWEPDPNPPKVEPKPAHKKRFHLKNRKMFFVPTPQPKVKKATRLEDLVFWEAEPENDGILTLRRTLELLLNAVEPMPDKSDNLVAAVSSAKLYLEPGTL